MEVRLTITETTAAQRKMTIASFEIPGNADSADRKISMQMKNSKTVLARLGRKESETVDLACVNVGSPYLKNSPPRLRFHFEQKH